ncbi:1,4-alpha-glucan branching protein GlgB [Micrococcus terreus]|uniref:1,4-alpha-glucan branching protein GlgB n=1 Tax=Micrococcus terreus TaxID=574650 RepID=UPI0023F9B8BA|nr:1,4-alpha-glucan branching protein GlgB [Micrococcus terreus]
MTTSRPILDLVRPWLATQRWFPGGPDAEVTRVGGLRLSDPAGQVGLHLHLLSVAHDDGPVTVSVPVTVRSAALEGGESALIGQTSAAHGETGEPREVWVYDGTHDPVFVAAWLEMMRRGLATADGRCRGRAHAGFQDWSRFEPAVMKARVLTGEQSNTSVVVEGPDGSVIVKFFRVIAAGENPDVQIGLALTEAGSTEVPVTYGEITAGWRRTGTEGEDWDSGAVSVLREFVADSQDAWRLALDAAVSRKDFTGQAAGIGQATGRMHRALAASLGTSEVTAVGAADTSGAQDRPQVLVDLAERIRWGWRQASTAVGEDCAPAVEAVVGKLEDPSVAAGLTPLQRIHADYHLGQVLVAPDRDGQTRWTVLDFEGEPLRDAAERSGMDLPLRDVVGMLRSFDYAGAVAAREHGGGDRTDARRELQRWTDAAQRAFLAGYGQAVGTPVDTDSVVFTALMLDKALYEVAYEQRQRPDWVQVPAAAVRRALDRASVERTSAAHPDATHQEAQMSQQDASTAGPTPEPAAQTASPVHAGATPLAVASEVLSAVARGEYHQPHEVLGAHLDGSGTVTYRVLRPLADSVAVRLDEGGQIELTHEHDGVWVGTSAAVQEGHVPGYRILVAYDGAEPELQDDAYRYLPTLGELDQHLIREGRHETLWTVLGARVHRYSTPQGEVVGTAFAVWAPNAQIVRVKGDFNGWNGRQHAMRSLGDSGIWEVFIPGVQAGAVYKYEIRGADGVWRDKSDPMARWTEVSPATGSRVEESRYSFGDQDWMERRAQTDPHQQAMSVYEVHAGSWRPGLDYREMAEQLVEYVSWQGFTHVEFMPVAEHPFGGSWGYQVTGYYAPTSRFGTPDDFKYLVDRLHQAGIGVLLDWVPAHFPKDEWALARFDGGPLYEYADPRKGEHPDWGTLVFDFGRTEVRNFLVANALYWLEEFHIDGLRVDAVASMLYLDYSREDGQWVPNIHGGNHNLEAISFLQEATATAYKRNPGTMMIAEESTAFNGVTAPTSTGGLGFGEKWNMGWMHDSLTYMSEDPVNRRWHHHQMTFSLVYAWSENYVLPLSHDEVVHGKGSLLRKMPGDRWQQLASLRAYYGFMWAHPGKQLLFMGSEFGQEAEWNEAHGLDWWLTDIPQHKGLMKTVRDLNLVYRNAPELWSQDHDPAGFQWIDQNDADRNLFSFIRWSVDSEPLVCVSNFSGSPHHGVRLGLPREGAWTEVVNTDAEAYGGSGVSNGPEILAEPTPWHGQPASAEISVPPLATVYFRPQA